eukprot:NODE_94_length_21525_cov_0.751003.p1 type:complete len:850 gc:universal NODE_94_length_21525_cov_0.751003:11455-14004(+)
MPLVSPNEIIKLQQVTNNIRNISLFAHVDHGKSSLADHLIASNGVFHSKMASKMRYLDFREDEVEKGITMKSAGISLIYDYISNENNLERYVFHLIDNPGHLDFIQETFLTAYLADGAVFLVDVVEGLTLSARGMLMKILDNGIPLVLVFNKMDRLIIEKKLTPNEAYEVLLAHLSKINDAVLEWYKVNSFGAADPLETDWFSDFFHPLKGNVVFASASDGWAFRPSNFAKLYSQLWNIPYSKLHNMLWGAFYPNKDAEEKASQLSKLPPTLLRKAREGKLSYCSVEWMFKPIWMIYSSAGSDVLPEMSISLESILAKLNINLNGRDKTQVFGNNKNVSVKDRVNTIFRYWLPLSRCILDTSVECFPDPNLSSRYRLHKVIDKGSKFSNLWFGWKWGLLIYPSKRFGGPMQNLTQKWSSSPPWCSSYKGGWQNYVFHSIIEEDQVLAFCCKLITCDEKDLIRPEINLQLLEAEMALNENSTNSTNSIILGIVRMYSGYLKQNSEAFVTLSKSNIVHKVKIKSVFILMGRGYAQVPLLYPGSIGAIEFEPVESIGMQMFKIFTLSNLKSVPNLSCHSEEEENALIKVALEPEDPRRYEEFQKSLEWLNTIDPAIEIEHLNSGEHVLVCAGELHLERCLHDLKSYSKMGIQTSEPLVPFRECILSSSSFKWTTDAFVITIECFPITDISWKDDVPFKTEQSLKILTQSSKKMDTFLLSDLDFDCGFLSELKMGFQLAAANGPLCAEPLMGAAFLVKEIITTALIDNYSKYVTSFKEMFLKAVLNSSPRIALAVYEVDIETLPESIGKVYQVVSKRKGWVLSEKMMDGSNYFTIKAVIPVIESIGVSDGISF